MTARRRVVAAGVILVALALFPHSHPTSDPSGRSLRSTAHSHHSHAHLHPGLGQAAQGGGLAAVAASSPANVWAVGVQNSGVQFQSLLLHWDGRTWSRATSPHVRVLTDVETFSEDDAWAIGGARILHWDGATWEPSRHPSPPGMNLTAIDGSGPNDIWAVGTRHGERWREYGVPFVGSATLTMHWDGSTWRVVDSPNGARRLNAVTGVVALSPTNVWLVGSSRTDQPTRSRTMTQHWDGNAWNLVPSPNPDRKDNVLNAVGTDSAGGVWAIGEYGAFGSVAPIYLKWSDRSWNTFAGPSGGAAVSGASANEVWVVGCRASGCHVIARWDGETWSKVKIRPADTRFGRLADVAALPTAEAWAVGSLGARTGPDRSFTSIPLVQRWDGRNWQTVTIPTGV